jgi:hypothetical protein
MSIKLSLKRTWIILLIAALMLASFGFSVFLVLGSGKIYASAGSFDAFSEEATDIIRAYDAGAPERYKFDIKSDNKTIPI